MQSVMNKKAFEKALFTCVKSKHLNTLFLMCKRNWRKEHANYLHMCKAMCCHMNVYT